MPSIEQVYFSGYQREKIIVTGIQTPNSIAIDFAANKLYWGDARLDKIERADFDGSHREVRAICYMVPKIRIFKSWVSNLKISKIPFEKHYKVIYSESS